jgi:hypothetical protein
LALTTSGEFIISTVRLGPAEHVSLVRTLVRLSGGGVVDRCGFCGSTHGPFTSIEGMFTVLMCPACLARRSRGRGPYPELSDAEMRAGLDLLPTWALQQKAAAFSVPTTVANDLISLASCARPFRSEQG